MVKPLKFCEVQELISMRYSLGMIPDRTCLHLEPLDFFVLVAIIVLTLENLVVSTLVNRTEHHMWWRFLDFESKGDLERSGS